ncbi:MAG: hypothetical protein Q9162_002743 [Coniocarpon cinnabarinum]
MSNRDSIIERGPPDLELTLPQTTEISLANSNETLSSPPSSAALKEEQPKAAAPAVPPATPQPPSYPSAWVFGINMTALCIAVFCLALDATIISTAIPQITNQFHSLDDVGWYGSAYLLMTAAFQLPFGKVYGLFGPKWTFLVSLFIFELGSLICGVAPGSVVLIVGRSIAGVGVAGVFSGALIIIAHTSPMDKRPIWQGLLSGMYGVASVLGPLIGGAFTDKVSWRWCFYINLPLGGAIAMAIVFFLRLPPHNSPFKGKTPLQMFLMLDPLGVVLFLGSIISLFIALQWGGTTYAWSNGRIIGLFVVFGLALIAFCLEQWWGGESALVPLRVAKQRTIWSATWFAIFLSGAFFLFVYFIPIYFQAVKGTSALASGIHTIALIVGNATVVFLSGIVLSKYGYVNPFVYASVVLTAVASALLTTLAPDTRAGKWIGYQLLFGIGCGLGFQQPPNAVQAVLPFKDLPIGIAVTVFGRHFGAALWIVVGNNVLDTRLLSELRKRAIPNVDPESVLASGATSFRTFVPTSALGAVVDAYSKALQKVYIVGLVTACVSVIGAVFIEWKSVKAKKAPPSAPALLKPADNGTAEKAQSRDTLDR